MNKKTGRHGLSAAAVLFFMYYSMGPVSAGYSRVISFDEESSRVQKASLAAEYGVSPAKEKVPVLEDGVKIRTMEENANVTQRPAAYHNQVSESLHEESLPDNSAIFRKFLAVINEQVKRIRLLLLGES